MRGFFALLLPLLLGLPAAAQVPVPSPVQVKIGVGGPMTGPDAVFGSQLRFGVEQAIEDINVSGGHHGQEASDRDRR